MASDHATSPIPRLETAGVFLQHPTPPAGDTSQLIRMSRRIPASTRGRPGWRRCEIFAQYPRNRSRFHRATVSALTMSRRLAHPGHDLRSATQNARSVSSRGGRGRAFFSAVTCCRRARFSITRSARRRHNNRVARAPSETRKMTTRSIAAECAAPSPRSQAGKSVFGRGENGA